MIEIGTKIKELRISKKLSQKELAEFLNVTPQAVSKWELNKSYPDIDTLVKLSRLFDVSTDVILGEAKQSFFDSFFKNKGWIKMNQSDKKNTQPNNQLDTVDQTKEDSRKKIAFVLYANNALLGTGYLSGVPNKKKLEETIFKALEKDYLVTFKWEAAKELGVEALIIPKPFYPIFNKDKIEEINVPATLFVKENIEEIKLLIDDHFKNKLK